jgi:hypothetical protein
MLRTLSGVHKLCTSQLIAVMVKEERVKRVEGNGNWEKAKKRRVFSITSFTAF